MSWVLWHQILKTVYILFHESSNQQMVVMFCISNDEKQQKRPFFFLFSNKNWDFAKTHQIVFVCFFRLIPLHILLPTSWSGFGFWVVVRQQLVNGTLIRMIIFFNGKISNLNKAAESSSVIIILFFCFLNLAESLRQENSLTRKHATRAPHSIRALLYNFVINFNFLV